MKKSQFAWIKEKLLKEGKISRNECLKNYITRLSAYILSLREQYVIDGEYVTKPNGSKDFVYYLIRAKK